MGRVSSKVAVVTGGANGIGAATCERLSDEGATVVVADIDVDSARDLAARLGNGALARAHDVTSEADWARLLAEISSTFGRLDVLVNNAGIVVVADVLDTTLEQFRRVNAVSVEGTFLGCKYAIPVMHRGRGGSIVNVSSIASHMGYSQFCAYSAAKGAVRSMTKSIAIACQMRRYQIRCNSIHPGSIETAMTRIAEGRAGGVSLVPDGVLPIGASGAPRDVANLVLFLASDESRFITGAEYVIDNGSTICQEVPPPA
jgi:3(or 17)beta-hydroxysteroid dehydrogenase